MDVTMEKLISYLVSLPQLCAFHHNGVEVNNYSARLSHGMFAIISTCSACSEHTIRKLRLTYSLAEARSMIGYKRNATDCCLCIPAPRAPYEIRINGICAECRGMVAAIIKTCIKKITLIRHLCADNTMPDVSPLIVGPLVLLQQVSRAE
jgi:hypothetical protein